MRRYSFVLFLMCFSVITYLYLFQPFQFIQLNEIENLKVNDRVFFISKISEERFDGFIYKIYFEDGIYGVCNCNGFIGKNMKVYAIVQLERNTDKTYFKILKMEKLS